MFLFFIELVICIAVTMRPVAAEAAQDRAPQIQPQDQIRRQDNQQKPEAGPSRDVPALGAQGQTVSSNYVIGAQDVLTITVWDQADMSGKFTVESDGTFTFPLIGRVTAGGLTMRGLEDELKRRLKDGFFKDPQLSVGVDQYRSRRIYVV